MLFLQFISIVQVYQSAIFAGKIMQISLRFSSPRIDMAQIEAIKLGMAGNS